MSATRKLPSSHERRPFDDTEERVLISKARGHYPQAHLAPTRCRTCREPYPCQPAEPAEEPTDLGIRWIIAASVVALTLLTVTLLALGR